MVKCENEYCIYWSENRCLLDNVSVDGRGLCQSCVLVSLSEWSLGQLREEALCALGDIEAEKWMRTVMAQKSNQQGGGREGR